MYRRSRRSSMAVPPHTLNYYAGEGEGEGVFAGEGIFAGEGVRRRRMAPHLLAGTKPLTEEQFLRRSKPKRYTKMTSEQWHNYLTAHAPIDKRVVRRPRAPKAPQPVRLVIRPRDPQPGPLRVVVRPKRRLSEWAKWLQTHAGTERTRGSMAQRRARFLQDQGGFY